MWGWLTASVKLVWMRIVSMSVTIRSGVFQRSRIQQALAERGVQVGVIALVVPAEAMPLTDIGQAFAVQAGLRGALLEGVAGAVGIGLGRRALVQQRAELGEVGLRGRTVAEPRRAISSRSPSVATRSAEPCCWSSTAWPPFNVRTFADLKEAVEEGLASGPGIPGEQVFRELRARIRRIARQKKAAKAKPGKPQSFS